MGVLQWNRTLFLCGIRIGHHNTKLKKKDNPETPEILGTQDTGRRQTKQNKNKTQKTKKMSNTDPTKIHG